MHSLILPLVLALGALSPVAKAQTTYGEIPLDTGGWVSGLVQHPSGRLYGYGDIFGVYRSDDFGANWKFLQGSITENVIFVQGLAVSPVDVNRVSFSGAGSLWNSIDGGETWTKRLSDLNNPPMTRGSKPIAYHPTQPDELWTAAPRKSPLSGSLWRSIDQGANWTLLGGTTFVNERAVTIHIYPAAPNEIWVGTAAVTGLSTTGGLWCSVDSGANWSKVWNNNGSNTQYYGPPQVSCIARNASRVSLFSTNTGVWQVTATNWNDPATYVVTQRTFANQNIPNVTVLADGTFWTTEIGDQTWAPKVSSDGVTWTDRQITHSPGYIPEWSSAEQITSYNRVYGRDMMVQDINNPSRWLLTGGASAHLSEDNGITWRYQPGGMAGIASYRVHFDEVDPGRYYLSTSDRGIFIGNDGGRSGKTFNSSRRSYNELHTFHETMVSTDGQTLVAAGVNQGISRTVMIRSTDAGATWVKFSPNGLPTNHEGVTRSVMARDNPDDFLVLLGYTAEGNKPNSPGLYRTTDGGANFVKVGGTSFDGVDTGMRYHPEYSFLERDGVNPNIRYLCLRSSNVPSATGLWRSTDGGTSWVWRGNPQGGGAVFGFAVDPEVEGRLWAGTNQSLRRSDDGGGTWTSIAGFTSAISVSAHAGRIAALGKRTGDTFNKIYSSLDNGMTWEEMTNSQNRMIWAQNVTVDPWRPGQIWVSGSRSYQIINPPATLASLLTGTSSGSASESGNPASNAFDGNIATAFAPAANGGLAELDLGEGTSARVSMIRFFPRAGFEARMNGGRFEGSADGSTWKTLASVTANPLPGWQTLVTGDPGFYRYLRYIHPTGLADVAEIEFRGKLAAVPTISNPPLTLSGLVGKHLSFTIATSGHPAPTFAITSGSLPAGLALNAQTGEISGTATEIGSGSLDVQATNFMGSTQATVTLDVAFGPRISAMAPSMHYQGTNATGTAPIKLTNAGNAPLSWSVTIPSGSGWLSSISPASSAAAGGNLAPGASITLNATVNTSGIALGQTRNVNLNFASNDPVNPSLTAAFKLTVGTAPDAPVIFPNQSSSGPRSGTISYALQASNSPAGWALASGSLPTGVVLNPMTGVVSGSPSSEGTFTAGFTATNHGGTSPVETFQLSITPPAPASNYDFNVSQVHFEETFNETDGWPWSPSAGVGGGGGLTTNSITRAAVIPASMITFTTSGQSVELGISFKARVGGTNAGGDSLRLGLSRVSTPLLTAGAGYLTASINKAPSTSTQSVLATEARNSNSTIGTSDTDVLTLADLGWYAVEATITYNGSNSFTVVSKLYDLGATGIATPALLDTYSVTRTGLTDMVNQPLYAGFQGFSSGGFGSVRTFDNFYARLPQVGTGLTTFRANNGLAADGSQDLLTPGGDGVENLLKYAFNMIGSGAGQSPSLATPNVSVLAESGAAGLPRVGTNVSGKLQITYIRRKSSTTPGVQYVVKFSDSLTPDEWTTNASATEVITSVDATFERVEVTDSSSSPGRFGRVQVTTL